MRLGEEIEDGRERQLDGLIFFPFPSEKKTQNIGEYTKFTVPVHCGPGSSRSTIFFMYINAAALCPPNRGNLLSLQALQSFRSPSSECVAIRF